MTSRRLRLAFAGTPELAARILATLLHEARHTVVAVLTQPDRPAGRGRKIQASPVKQAARASGIEVYQPGSRSGLAAISILDDIDALIVVAYGMIIPPEILDQPTYGCINVHTSLLPRWRGAAPIQRAIQHGDRETGVSIMQMDAGLDTGPVILQRKCPIAPRETAATLHDKLAGLGSQALSETLGLICSGSAAFTEQDNARANYADKITKQQARLDWRQPAEVLDRMIRAFNPAPVAHASLNGQELRIWEADCDKATTTATPGTIINCSRDGIEVACAPGILKITRLQLPGKKPLNVSDLLNSRPAFLDP
ncbi:MAG: methionyl-tRNA formyltransferase [Thiotrichales bacterium]|nr:methionyl-tRNA formyltransferase [Thiotrichales bacterium]